LIAPAVETLKRDGIDASGPAPADTLFHPAARSRYDAALCMYHDQALIPIKTVDFAGGVNVTLGVPFVRTSPDHGTALDIAGSGRADPTSLITALAMADDRACRRRTCRRPSEGDARRASAAARDHRPTWPWRPQASGPALPARPQPDAPHRPRRRSAR